MFSLLNEIHLDSKQTSLRLDMNIFEDFNFDYVTLLRRFRILNEKPTC